MSTSSSPMSPQPSRKRAQLKYLQHTFPGTPTPPQQSAPSSAGGSQEKVPAPTDTGRISSYWFSDAFSDLTQTKFHQVAPGHAFLQLCHWSYQNMLRRVMFSLDAVICPQGTCLKSPPRPKPAPSTLTRFNPKCKDCLWRSLGAASYPPPSSSHLISIVL